MISLLMLITKNKQCNRNNTINSEANISTTIFTIQFKNVLSCVVVTYSKESDSCDKGTDDNSL